MLFKISWEGNSIDEKARERAALDDLANVWRRAINAPVGKSELI